MKTPHGKSILVLAVLSVLGLSACNIDISADGKPVASISTTKTGVVVDLSKGVTVNGVTYDTSQASVVVNGQASDLSALKEGMVVSVSGTENPDGTGKANTIYYEDEIKGVVSTNRVAADASGTLDVMGQTVRVDKDTVFESFDVADLSVSDIDQGNVVEVSGYASGDGEIWATRIEVKDSQYNSGEQIELHGNISGLTATSFTIGNQVINSENAALDSNFMGTLQNGQYVEVKSANGFDANGVLLASEINLKDNGVKEVSHTETDEQVEIKGVITNTLSSGELEVNGAVVTLGQNIKLSASALSQLDKGVMVEVEGYIDANGKMIATSLQIASSNNSDSSSVGGSTDFDSGTGDDNGSSVSESNSDDLDSDNEINEVNQTENDND